MSYIADPSDNTKQIPSALPDSAFQTATAPVKDTLVDRASKVFILDGVADIQFAFTSASFAASEFVNFNNFTVNAGGIELNIQPVAWSGSAAAGSVVFIYNGGK